MPSSFRHAMRVKWACPLLPAAMLACASAAPIGAPVSFADASTASCASDYSIINLGPRSSDALLNAVDQVAFTISQPDGAGNTVTRLRYFDGRRTRDYGVLQTENISLEDINAHGTVVGQLRLASAPFDLRAFTWSAARGLRFLPGSAAAVAHAVNDQGRTVGWAGASEGEKRAALWNKDGALFNLGPPPPIVSEAYAINRHGKSAGGASGGGGDMQAMVWNANGAGLALGIPAGSTSTVALHINSAGEVAGALGQQTQRLSFYWSRERGIVPITVGGDPLFTSALNEHGDVAGNILTSEGQGFFAPYVWSYRSGVRQLPMSGAPTGRLYGLNNRREMVGHLQFHPQDTSLMRATHWTPNGGAVDLNTRLHRPPPGLVLYAARAVNDNGVILAESNAGLVLLRPGRQGTAAPVLGPIGASQPYSSVSPGTTLDLAVGFVDSSTSESHTATASINDGCPATAPSLRETRGVGEVNLRHTFCRTGAFVIKVKVTDRAGNATEVADLLFVADRGAAAGSANASR